MVEPLEEIAMKEAPKSGLREYLADTTAALTFGFAVGSMIKYVNGVPTDQLLISAGIDAVVNLTTGGIYGKWRDYVKSKFSTVDKSGFWKKYWTDITAAYSFYIPLAAGALAVSGVSAGKILTTLATVSVVSLFTARPQGLWIDLARKLFGVKKQEPYQGTQVYNKNSTPN